MGETVVHPIAPSLDCDPLTVVEYSMSAFGCHAAFASFEDTLELDVYPFEEPDPDEA
jgi:hypothetical protein